MALWLKSLEIPASLSDALAMLRSPTQCYVRAVSHLFGAALPFALEMLVSVTHLYKTYINIYNKTYIINTCVHASGNCTVLMVPKYVPVLRCLRTYDVMLASRNYFQVKHRTDCSAEQPCENTDHSGKEKLELF